jgi:hypothetical protein
MRLYPVCFAALALAACVAEYSKSEAPDELRVDGAETRRELAFAAGSAYLPQVELRRITQWILSGSIRPADRVEIAAAGRRGSPGSLPFGNGYILRCREAIGLSRCHNQISAAA